MINYTIFKVGTGWYVGDTYGWFRSGPHKTCAAAKQIVKKRLG